MVRFICARAFHISENILRCMRPVTVSFVLIISTSRIDFKTKGQVTFVSLHWYSYYDSPIHVNACLTCINKLLMLSVMLIVESYVTLECSNVAHVDTDKYPQVY
jgi:hypothetical protein